MRPTSSLGIVGVFLARWIYTKLLFSTNKPVKKTEYIFIQPPKIQNKHQLKYQQQLTIMTQTNKKKENKYYLTVGTTSKLWTIMLQQIINCIHCSSSSPLPFVQNSYQ